MPLADSESEEIASGAAKPQPWTEEQRKVFGDALKQWLERRGMYPSDLAHKILLNTGKSITG